MTKDQQFTVPLRQFQDMHPAELESLCTRLLPDMQFRFASFEDNNYRNGDLTCWLYSYVPQSVCFCVETPLEIEPALEKLIEINPGVKWYWAALNYIDYDVTGHSRVVIELSLLSIPMRVSAAGKLVSK